MHICETSICSNSHRPASVVQSPFHWITRSWWGRACHSTVQTRPKYPLNWTRQSRPPTAACSSSTHRHDSRTRQRPPVSPAREITEEGHDTGDGRLGSTVSAPPRPRPRRSSLSPSLPSSDVGDAGWIHPVNMKITSIFLGRRSSTNYNDRWQSQRRNCTDSIEARSRRTQRAVGMSSCVRDRTRVSAAADAWRRRPSWWQGTDPSSLLSWQTWFHSRNSSEWERQRRDVSLDAAEEKF